MRRMRWLVGVSVVTAGTAALIAACGGTSSNGNNGGTDSGASDTSVADTSTAADSAGDVTDAAAPACDTDANLNTLNVADAALGDGGGSVGTCIACAKQNCASEVADCNADCQCVGDFTDFYNCLSKGGSLTTCGGGIFQGADSQEQAIGQCVFTSCADECNLHFNMPDAAPKDSASDSPTDAPADGG